MAEIRHNNILTKKFRLPHSSIVAISFVLAIVVGLVFINLMQTIVTDSDDYVSQITILDNGGLLNALHNANQNGVQIAIHGWEHEDYTLLTTEQINDDIRKSKAVFTKSNLPNNIFVCPYEISGVPLNPEVAQKIEANGVTLLNNGDVLHEYTWNWFKITSASDPRIVKANLKIAEDKPTIIICHAQDWNKYTYAFLENYVSKAPSQSLSIRMDDIDVNDKSIIIDQFASLKQYPSLKSVTIATIPSGKYAQASVTILGIPISAIMGCYFGFYIITALFPLLFFIFWKYLSILNTTRVHSKIIYPDLVSVVIPAYNEAMSIESCIESFLNQNYPGKIEIIVVSDGSTDKTVELASKYSVKVIDKPNGGKSSALNVGIKESRGDIILFTDGDTYMDKDAVQRLIECFHNLPNVDIVTGNVLVNEGENKVLTYFQRIEYHIEQDLSRYLQGLNESVVVCPGPITAVRRKVTNTVQFTKDTIVEDADFTITALKNDFKIVRCGSAKCYTNAPQSLTSWVKQRKRWWYGNLQLWRLHKTWSITNAWMVYNYLGYVISTFSVFMLLSMPLLLMQYSHPGVIMLRGLLCIGISLALYMLTIGLLFVDNKELIPSMIPYMLIYSIMKMFMLSYLYINYITGRGMDVQFGPNKMHIK